MGNMSTVSTICTDLAPIIKLIKHGLIPILQIGIPIILIVFGMLDLGKAVIASKEDEIKNAQKMLIKRAIYSIAVFLIVTIVTLVFNIFVVSGVDNDISGTQDWRSCWDTV